MTWEAFKDASQQLGILIAITGLTYRLLRLKWPDVPEAVIQFLAAMFSSVAQLAALYTPEIPKYQWLTLGIASGVLVSQNVIVSISWISSAATKTGAPTLGLPEKPPQWYVDLHPELVDKPPTNGGARTLADVQAKARAQAEADAAAARIAAAPPTPPPPTVPKERDA